MKKFRILVLITLMMFLPFKVHALTGSIEVDCNPKNVAPGNEVKCVIKGTSDENVTAFNIPFELSDNLTAVSFDTATGWGNADISDGNIDSYTSDNMSGTFNIGTLTIRVNADAPDGEESIKFTNIKFYDENEKEIDITDKALSLTVKEQEEVSKGLTNLTVTNGKLQPDFTTTGVEYQVIISSNTFGLTATPANSSDTVKFVNGSTNEELNSSNITYNPVTGQNMMLIEIIVGSGSSETKYELVVSKEQTGEEPTYDNTLKSLTVGGKTVELKSGVYDYTITLESTRGYEVKSVLNDPENFTFDDKSNGNGTGSGPVYTIIVLPKDASKGTSVTYTININTNSTPTPSTPGSNNKPTGGGTNVNTNPNTGDIPAFLMAIVLVASLVVSIILYKRNMNSYN